MKIFKYQLPVREKFDIDLPNGARIIRVEDVAGEFFLWAMVDENETEVEARHLEFYKTGQSIDAPSGELVFLGTCKLFIMMELCLYVFERVRQ